MPRECPRSSYKNYGRCDKERIWQKKAQKLWEDKSGFLAIQSTQNKKNMRRHIQIYQTRILSAAVWKLMPNYFLHLQSLYFANSISQDFV